MSRKDMNDLHWYTFKYVYIHHRIHEDIHREIVDWTRENRYGPGVFSGKYNSIYVFATNNDEIASHFKLTWVSRLTTHSRTLNDGGYKFDLIGNR